jgi:hypothetical protein
MSCNTAEKSSVLGEPKPSARVSVENDPVPLSFDSDPADRRMDRLLAYLGMLDDAAPLFRSGANVPHGGVLLALPALVESGIFTIVRKIYGSIGPAFYGLRTTFIALLLMALLRIKRPEALKEHSPEDLGRVLGLDRRLRSRPCDESSAAWRPSDVPLILDALWRRNALMIAAPPWVFSMLMGTSGFTTANGPFRRRTSRAGVWQCRRQC